MFAASQKVICVDDKNPNPRCRFPLGYVVRGHFYYVKGVTPTGGILIEGLPVIGHIGTPFEGEVGWKPQRFRKFEESGSAEEMGDPSELELVGV